jgi:ribosomal protein S12 methylthiotransferase
MAKIYPVSLGCAKNKADFEKLLYILQKKGHEFVLFPEEADIFWINTCAFIRPAVEEALDHIFELGELKGDSKKLIVSGCLPARYGKEKLKELLPEVDEFYGIEPFRIFSSTEPVGRILSESPFYAYLKIAEGCNKKCSYCTIPKIRGPFRSKPRRFILKEAEYLLKSGVKEIILVAQDLTSYGKDRGEKDGLVRLLNALSNLPFKFRIRLLYLFPSAVNKTLVDEVISNPKVVPYFDIPIQHSHPEILKRMKRPFVAEKWLKTIEYIRKLNPFAGIRSTVIVGFPGEGEKEFLHLCEFLKEAKFDYLGVFIFYPEEGTLAEKLGPKVSYKEKIKRKQEILRLQKEITKERLKLRVGQDEEILILGEDVRGRSWGIASFQAPEVDGITYILAKKNAIPGEFVKIKIKKSGIFDIWGK